MSWKCPKCEKDCLTCECEKNKSRKLIENCDITSVRVMNALSICGFVFLDELQNLSAEELRQKYSGIGKFTIREIRKLLACHGMSLKGDILCNSEEEKKIILDMPKTINGITDILRDVERQIRHLTGLLDEIKANMQEKK